MYMEKQESEEIALSGAHRVLGSNVETSAGIDEEVQQIPSSYNTGFIVIVTFAGSLGGFLNGYDTGIISGA
jgi:hypothetical protein